MRYKLIKHNSAEQREWGNNDDTLEYLKVGEIYEAEKDVHSWHTKLVINGHRFNSVCFEELSPKARKV